MRLLNQMFKVTSRTFSKTHVFITIIIICYSKHLQSMENHLIFAQLIFNVYLILFNISITTIKKSNC